MSESWETILDKITPFALRRGLTSFVNPYSMLILERHLDVARGIDYWHVDGISLVHLINKSLNKDITRHSFDETSLAPVVFKHARENNLSIAIIGTTDEAVSKAVHQIEKSHQIKVAYHRNGYFLNELETSQCISLISQMHIDIVICGMGTPYQENFLIKLKDSGWNGYGYSCGGYLHQTASKGDYYPPIYDKLNMRWIYRIIDEPKLISRYFLKYPVFFLKFKIFNRN
jgi:exopolysaccharide biosynthesis WecB/TagA/CpsF family protein